MAGVALGHIHLRFAWQAWHLWHWAGSGGALGPVLVAGDAAALCVAGVALGDIHLRFAWQAWHLVTSSFVLRGRRGTYGTGLALVARLGRSWSPVTPWHFAWQAWHLVTSTFVSRSFTHHLLHTIFGTQLLHTIFDTQLCHTPSFTHHLSHTMFDTPSFTPHL